MRGRFSSALRFPPPSTCGSKWGANHALTSFGGCLTCFFLCVSVFAFFHWLSGADHRATWEFPLIAIVCKLQHSAAKTPWQRVRKWATQTVLVIVSCFATKKKKEGVGGSDAGFYLMRFPFACCFAVLRCVCACWFGRVLNGRRCLNGMASFHGNDAPPLAALEHVSTVWRCWLSACRRAVVAILSKRGGNAIPFDCFLLHAVLWIEEHRFLLNARVRWPIKS